MGILDRIDAIVKKHADQAAAETRAAYFETPSVITKAARPSVDAAEDVDDEG